MTAFAHATIGNTRAYASERRMLKLTMRASYPFFFAVTLLQRINPFEPTASAPQSLLAETRARAAAIVPFIFMG